MFHIPAIEFNMRLLKRKNSSQTILKWIQSGSTQNQPDVCDSLTFVRDSVEKRVIDQKAVSLWPALRLPTHHQLTQGRSL